MERRGTAGKLNLLNMATEGLKDFLEQLRPTPFLEVNNYDFKARWKLMMLIAKSICPGFTLGKYNTEIYENGLRYFSGDKKASILSIVACSFMGLQDQEKPYFLRSCRHLTKEALPEMDFNPSQLILSSMAYLIQVRNIL